MTQTTTQRGRMAELEKKIKDLELRLLYLEGKQTREQREAYYRKRGF